MIALNIENKIKNIFYKIYMSIWIQSIRTGLLIIQPIVMVGCALTLIAEIPVEKIQQFTDSSLIYNWKNILISIRYQLYIVAKILTIVSISYTFISIYTKEKLKNKKINIMLITTAAIISVFIVTYNFNISFSENINASWSFVAMILSTIFSKIYIDIYVKLECISKNFEMKFSKDIIKLINNVIIIFFIILLVFSIRILITENLITVNYNKSYLGLGCDIINGIKYLLYTQIGWFFGGHGSDMVEMSIVNKSYINVFTNIGGTGSTIAIIIAVLIFNVNKYIKNTCKISILPSIFNINETITFGLPIIFNPIYIIPFIITPVILGIITIISLQLGFINIENTSMNYMVPIFFNAYILTGSINGIILQVLNGIIAVCIYIPFIKIDSRIREEERKLSYESLKNEILKNGYEKLDLDSINWRLREMYDYLSEDLYKNIIKDDNLYMEYQPQVNKKGKVIGLEALLRWNHDEFGNIPPNVIIIIAEKSGFIDKLGNWIINKSCSELEKFNEELDHELKLSINISALQFENKNFVQEIKTIVEKYNVKYNCIKLEITESISLVDDKMTEKHITDIAKIGMELVIDDFGVGYNPIVYIKKYKIQSIKLDKVLINDIHTSQQSRRIVESIYNLCKVSKIDIVSEFVEIEEQKIILDELGDGLYQGYLFSKPLKYKQCLEYIKEVGYEKYN